MTTTFKTPTVPFTIIDAVNRAAAATGSARYASAATGADYNGKRVSVSRSVRGTWGVSYTWAGLRWIARGRTLEAALEIATKAPEAKARGGLVSVSFYSDEPTDAELETIEAAGLLFADDADAVDATWKDGRFSAQSRGGTSTPHIAVDLDRTFGMGSAVAALLELPAGIDAVTAQAAVRDAAFAARSARRAR